NQRVIHTVVPDGTGNCNKKQFCTSALFKMLSLIIHFQNGFLTHLSCIILDEIMGCIKIGQRHLGFCLRRQQQKREHHYNKYTFHHYSPVLSCSVLKSTPGTSLLESSASK